VFCTFALELTAAREKVGIGGDMVLKWKSSLNIGINSGLFLHRKFINHLNQL